MSFLADDDDDDDDDNVILKYNKIWRKWIFFLSVELDSKPVYDEKYIKTRVKTFEDTVITKFTDNEIPKENTYYSCIATICVDPVIELEKKNILRSILSKCKLRLKKKKNIDFFHDELEDSSDKWEIEAEWI